MKNHKIAKNTITLHNDVLEEILLHLPMKQLAQFRHLSKYWNNTISKPRFTVERRTCSSNRTMFSYQNSVSATVYPRHHGGESILRIVSRDSRKNIPIYGKVIVVGTWDGLICLSYVETGNYVTVWNPLLKDIQKCYFEHIREGSCFFGFGFDDVNNEYKVLRVIQSRKETSIEIHSLYTKVASVVLLPSNQVPFKLTNAAPVTVNGYSHWIGVNLQNRELEIVWFDLAKEKFVIVPFSSSMPNTKFHLDVDSIASHQPTPELEINGLKFRLGVFRDSVCLFVSHSNLVEIWCMKKYGSYRTSSSQAWSKEFEIKLRHPREEVVGFSANDELVIGYKGKRNYVACNPWTQQVVFSFGNNGGNAIKQVVTYVESLVPANAPKPSPRLN